MVGVDQCGISDTIEYILHSYPPDLQQKLVQVSYILLYVLGLVYNTEKPFDFVRVCLTKFGMFLCTCVA